MRPRKEGEKGDERQLPPAEELVGKEEPQPASSGWTGLCGFGYCPKRPKGEACGQEG